MMASSMSEHIFNPEIGGTPLGDITRAQQLLASAQNRLYWATQPAQGATYVAVEKAIQETCDALECMSSARDDLLLRSGR